MIGLGLIALAILLLAALAYWELVIAEGVHLGPRIVTFLYDITAGRYNRIKQFTPGYEAWFLGEPLAQALSHVPGAIVLDVATGTGRLPMTLLRQPGFRGHVIGLDSSRAMLTQAAHDANAQAMAERLTLVWQEVSHLPFDDDTFDGVTCLEALEFFPDTRRALQEIVRVLRPGGVLLVTNRVGSCARFLPGHTQSRPAFEAMLASLDMTNIQTQTWQVEYDLVCAIKPGPRTVRDIPQLEHVLRCPECGGPLERVNHSVICNACGRISRVASDGVIELMRGSRR